MPPGGALYTIFDCPLKMGSPGMVATVANDTDLAGMRAAGNAAASVLEMICPHVMPGVTTEELDAVCHGFIVDELGCVPAPLNYGGGGGQMPFPKSICTSVNHVVCHGIPTRQEAEDRRRAQHRHHRDQGRLPRRHQQDVLRRRSDRARQASGEDHPGVSVQGHRSGRAGATSATSATPSRTCRSQRFHVVREFCGHGIGKSLSRRPQVLHYGRPGSGMRSRKA